MHILICVYFKAAFGGLHANVLATARYCVQHGHSVTILCREGPFRAGLSQHGISSIATDFSSTEESVQAVLAQGYAFDLIHSHPFASRKVALELGRRLCLPVVITYHGMYEDELAVHVSEYRAVLAVSQGIRDYLAGVVPEHRHKLLVAPNGVDRELFYPRAEASLRSGNGTRDKKRLLLVSRLDSDKRLVIEILLRALRHCASAHRGSVSWTVVGAGTELDAVRAEATEIAREGDFEIDFAGWLHGEALAAAYCASDIVIAPGRCVLEAMACGRPAIAVGSKGYVGLVTQDNWQTGAYTNFGGLGAGLSGYREGSVEQDLSLVIDNHELCTSLAALGPKLTERFYDERSINQQLLALYEMCAGTPIAR